MAPAAGHRAIDGGALVLALALGCQMVPNNFRDDFAGEPPVSTPSADAAWAIPVEREEPHRSFTTYTMDTESGAVSHLPLYFEDPFELPPPSETEFAWTAADFADMAYSPARFLANLACVPLSMIGNPPWQRMESDGIAAPRGLLREPLYPAVPTRANSDSADGPTGKPAAESGGGSN